MICPYCGHSDSKVMDSRGVDNNIRRRRQCLKCSARFTTFERAELPNLFIIKKDRRREEYNRDKLLTGIRKSCEKRPLPTGAVDKAVNEIEAELYRTGKAEIKSTVIGELVMEKLKKLDYIAYIRFASVYRPFTDISALKQAVDNLIIGETKPSPTPQLPLLPEENKVKIRRRNRK